MGDCMSKSYIFAIDLGGTTTKLAILNKNGNFVDKWEIKTDLEHNGKNIVQHIVQAFTKKCSEHHISFDQVLGVGMGAPGPVINGGVISKAVNIGWENYPLKEKLEEAFSLKAFVENDANCAALGEMWLGAGKGLKNIVAITLGTGVGGGVIINGDIVGGISGGAGEIGHMTVKLDDGAPCNCGKKGCLETIASATGVVRLALKKLETTTQSTPLKTIYQENNGITAKDVFDLAAKGDALSLEIVEEVAYYLGYGIGILCTILNPEAVIIGGGVSKAGKTLTEPLQNYVKQFAFPPSIDDTSIRLAKLGNDAGVIGAGWLVKKHCE